MLPASRIRLIVCVCIVSLWLILLDLVTAQSFINQQKAVRVYKKYYVPHTTRRGVKEKCKVNEFTCRTTGNCIPLSGYCNFDQECDDNSDETDCVRPKCNPQTEFECKNGECINITLYNNFVYDCWDKSDEDDKVCNGFQCNDGKCIPSRLKCDGEIDCAGIYKEDERGCDDNLPSDDEEELWFKYGIGFCKNGRPYSRNDECKYTTTLGYMDTCRDATHLENCESYQCPPSMHKCPDSYCIPYEVRCDDIMDCPYGEDEFDCNRKDNGAKSDLPP